jgi:serine/threonine protein kinase/tetratricopeptide (TPR) repeat protein
VKPESIGARGGGLTGPLVDAAGLVADGSDFDLLSLSSSLASDEDRAIADELAVVARIAQAHRKLHQVLPAPAPGSDTVPFASSWGHLDLIEVVGRGSYGTVYRAWDPRLDRLVALKLFHGARNPEAVMREGRMLARIRHENVVTVYGADVYNGIAGIWMEFVHGRRLDEVVEKDGSLGVDDATRVGVAVCRALVAVHAAGLLHCDVKAQNVIREQGGRIVLMDLGAGRETIADDDATAKLQVAGTPRYMAPEVFDRGSAIPQSDVYSVGVLLFYLTTGRFPVDGKTLSDIRRAHLEARRARLSDYRPDLPEPFVKSITRAIDPTPTARYGTPGELETELVGIPQPSEVATPRRSVARWTTTAASLAVLAAVVGGLGWYLATVTTPARPATRSLAVLPIKNLTGDASNAYLAEGLTEVFISNLARVRAFRVPSSSAVALADRNQPSSEIGKKLGVELLLAGSILSIGDHARMVVQLIDAASDEVLWSEELTPAATDLLSMPGDVARAVAERLSVGLSGDETRALARRQIDRRAQDAYLKGLVDLWSVDNARLATAAREFEVATTLQPDFAPAWAQWGMIELRRAQFAAPAQRAEHVAAARRLAARALSSDPNLPSALVVNGTAQFYYDWDFRGAENSYRTALRIDPSSTEAMQYLSGLLAATNRVDEAIALAHEAVQLEPLVTIRARTLAIMYFYGRDYDRALAQEEHALRLTPGYGGSYFGIGRIYAAMGRYDEAATAIERSIVDSRNFVWLSELRCVYAAAGRREDQRRIQAELDERARAGEIPSTDHLAHIAAADGRLDDGFKALQQAIANHEPDVLWMQVDPRLDPYRSDPRYIQLLKQAGLQ